MIKRSLFALILSAATLSAECCCDTPSLFAYASYHFGESLITNRNYTEVGAYYIPDLSQKRFGVYVEAEGLFIENGDVAQSTGVGLRFRDSKLNWVWGINAFGDTRMLSTSTLFQVGVGFELYTPCFDFHLNGYIPTGPGHHYSDPFTHDYIGPYSVTVFTEDFLYRGVDFLFSKYFFPTECVTLYGGLGGYYFDDGRDDHVPGFQMRGTIWWNSTLFAGLLYTYDDSFGSRAEGRVGITIPLDDLFNPRKLFERCCNQGCYTSGWNGKQGPLPRLGRGCICGCCPIYQPHNF